MSKIAGEINHHMMRNAKTRSINAPALDLIADILEQHTAGILAGVKEHMDKRKSEARSAGFDAADMATAAAQGFRDGVAGATREMPSWDEVFDCAVAAYCRSSTSHDALRLCFQSRSQQHQIACGWTANDLMGFARGIAALYAPPTSAEGVEHG